MSGIAKFTLLFVVFVDLMNQGLVFPILNALIMEPEADFLSLDTSVATRHIYYGIVIGLFFLGWFVGVLYIAKISDSIGRKQALVICLVGAVLGYAIAIFAIYINSFWLLVLGRTITGFAAGNQAVAQAAMIDASHSAQERDRNMGLIITGCSFGLVGGPLIGAFFSDSTFIGDYASLTLPLYVIVVLVLIALLLTVVFFHDVRQEREPFVFRMSDLISGIQRVRQFPLVAALLPVFIFFLISMQTFFVFTVNYLTSAFGYGVVGGSVAMLVVGIGLGISSSFLVKPFQASFARKKIVYIGFAIMGVSAIMFSLVGVAVLTFIPLFVYFMCVGTVYPTLLGIFSSSVDEHEQGWVMGVTTSLIALVSGLMSLVGGILMSIDINLPFYISFVAAISAFLLVLATWGRPHLRKIVD